MRCKCKIQKLYFKYLEEDWYSGKAVFPHTNMYDRIQKRLKCKRNEIYNAVYELRQKWDIGEIAGIITPFKNESTTDIPCKVRGLNIKHTEKQWKKLMDILHEYKEELK